MIELKARNAILTILIGTLSCALNAQDLDLLDQNDLDILNEPDQLKTQDVRLSREEEMDDLQSLREDLGQINFEEADKQELIPEIEEFEKAAFKRAVDPGAIDVDSKIANRKDLIRSEQSVEFFEVGAEERKLLEVAKIVENKMPEKEWNEIAAATKKSSHTVVAGDTLWDISRSLFGTGFYYPKIWSLNPYITNPHEIEPEMVLTFTTGSADELPEVRIGSFKVDSKQVADKLDEVKDLKNLDEFAEDAVPTWIKQREALINQGVYVQYASEYTYNDLKSISQGSLIKEYENYTPPVAELNVDVPDTYDASGFDKESKISYRFREGFHLNTFISTNLVQDFGEIDASALYADTLSIGDVIYVKFDPALNVAPGEKYSIYSAEGKVEHKLSERSGYKYVINGHIIVRGQKGHLWECEITDSIAPIKRGDRVTVHTPKIDKILKTFNQQNIEAVIVDSYDPGKTLNSFGSVLYIDRGRADGVEIGNIFEVFSFTDNSNGRKITPDPTYKIGELTVISLTDNFATALVTNSKASVDKGSLAITKTMEEAVRDQRIKSATAFKDAKSLETKALDELDVELNVNNLTDDLLKKADKIELTEDELEELERQERAKSVIKDHEKDLKELSRLEKEIESAELLLNEERTDKDQLLEDRDLDKLEAELKRPAPDSFESLDEIESEIGKKYLDEDLNAKDNPYGLTEFDIEEIDELLSTEPGTNL